MAASRSLASCFIFRRQQGPYPSRRAWALVRRPPHRLHRRAGMVNISCSSRPLTALTLPSCRSWSPGRKSRAGRPGGGLRSRTGYTGPGPVAGLLVGNRPRIPCRTGRPEGALRYGRRGTHTSSWPIFLPWRFPNQPLDAGFHEPKFLRPCVPGAVVNADIAVFW